MVLKKFVTGPLQNNVYLLSCEKTKRSAVFDPAMDSSELILDYLKKEELSLDYILITHSHWDHIADTAILKDKTKAKVAIHREDEDNLKSPGADGLPSFFSKGVFPDLYLIDSQIVEVGELKLQVIHTPGHTPGSVCFYIASQAILFSGDTLFKGSIGRLDLPTSDEHRMWASLKKLEHLPKETRVLPGHGSETTIGDEKWLNRAKELYSS